MPSTQLALSIAILAASLGGAALAGDHHDRRDHDASRMAAVPHASAPEAASHGWQYFSDPVARRAVVVSPQGDYYYSRGKGLRWMARAATGV